MATQTADKVQDLKAREKEIEAEIGQLGERLAEAHQQDIADFDGRSTRGRVGTDHQRSVLDEGAQLARDLHAARIERLEAELEAVESERREIGAEHQEAREDLEALRREAAVLETKVKEASGATWGAPHRQGALNRKAADLRNTLNRTRRSGPQRVI